MACIIRDFGFNAWIGIDHVGVTPVKVIDYQDGLWSISTGDYGNQTKTSCTTRDLEEFCHGLREMLDNAVAREYADCELTADGTGDPEKDISNWEEYGD